MRKKSMKNIIENGFRADPRALRKKNKHNCQGCLSKYSDTTLTERESSAFKDAVVEKYCDTVVSFDKKLNALL